MTLDENEVNRYLRTLFGRYEDSLQEAWPEILESNPKAMDEVTAIAKKVKRRAINRYLEQKYREESLQKPLGSNEDGTFTLESILHNPADDEPDETDRGKADLYKRIVNFLISECLRQRIENHELKRKEIELKAKRLRLRAKSLKFRKERFESWKQLMEEKGRQKERQIELRIELLRQKIKFQGE
ncbi:MAG TPA: hypothetical protein VMT62_13125 [Syntrophorhabdaceae bacterium]|nr:hypothetical protein [Syntrophorhabdaceae bacterium]